MYNFIKQIGIFSYGVFMVVCVDFPIMVFLIVRDFIRRK